MFDKGSIEELTLGCADHNQLAHVRWTATQAVMTLEEGKDGGWDRGGGGGMIVHR